MTLQSHYMTVVHVPAVKVRNNFYLLCRHRRLWGCMTWLNRSWWRSCIQILSGYHLLPSIQVIHLD